MSATLPAFTGSLPGKHLGRLAPPPGRIKKTIPLRNFVNITARPLPPTTDWFTAAVAALRLMLGNDGQGNCVAVTELKMIAMATAQRPGGKLVVPTEKEALAFYHEVGGPGDNGLVVTDALNRARDVGVKMGGTVHKIDGYAFVDPADTALVDFVLQWLGGVHTACWLPEQWYQHAGDADVWDLTNSRMVGGHSVPFTGREGDKYRLATWAKEPHVTRRAVESGRYFDEMYGVLHADWYNDSGLDANGVNVSALKAALDAVRNGQVPIIPDDPNPPTPPTPPTPPVGPGEIKLTGFVELLGQRLPVTLWGTLSQLLATAGPATWIVIALDLLALFNDARARNWEQFAIDLQKLLNDAGGLLTANDVLQIGRALTTHVELMPLMAPSPPTRT